MVKTDEHRRRGFAAAELAPLLELLHVRRGHDFSTYKSWTVQGRIERRMALREIEQIHDYENLLRSDASELSALFGDLLIGVTAFFRDSEAFESFGDALALSFRDRSHARLWVPGCASGEEAYSLAMILDEHCPRLDPRIFATDLDRAALDRARVGLFSGIEGAITPDRLTRYFRRSGETYEVARYLRDRIVFGTHDVFADPPLTHVDAISCRNVMIYLAPDPQRWLLQLFHFALERDGLLFLGNAESVGARSDLFEPVDAQARVYRRRDRPARLPLSTRRASRAAPMLLETTALHVLAEQLLPPSLVVDTDGHIVYAHGAIEPFLVDMSRRSDLGALQPNLASVGRATLAKVVASQRDLVVPGVVVADDHAIDLHVFAARSIQLPDLYVITLERAHSVHRESDPRETYWAALDRELQQEREDHRRTVEKLCAANQELRTMNETLQTTNEKLETTCEELVVLDTELRLVSDELASRTTETATAAADLANVLGMIGVGAVILDRDLRIARFTDRVQRLWQLTSADRGQPFADFVSGDVMQHVTAVVETLQSRTIELAAARVRIAPYRTVDHAIEGIVLAVEDTRTWEGGGQ